jgi:hypothetical protein
MPRQHSPRLPEELAATLAIAAEQDDHAAARAQPAATPGTRADPTIPPHKPPASIRGFLPFDIRRSQPPNSIWGRTAAGEERL